MALGDPAQILLISILTVLIPVLVIYWVVRLAVRHELKKRDRITTRS